MATSTFVEQLYNKFLGRSSEVSGLSYWVEQIDTGALNASQVTLDFINSSEFINSVAPIARLYYATLDRIPDAAGLLYWVNAYQSGQSLEDISNGFMASSEFQSNYGDLSDNSAFLEQLYQNVLNRQSDSGGLSYWLNQLDNGMSRAGVVDGFANSVEFTQAKGEDIKILLIYHGILAIQPDQSEIDAAVAANNPLALITQLYSNGQYAGEAVPGLSSSGVVVDGYVSGATVFIDADGDGLQGPNEVSVTTDGLGNFDFGDNAGFGNIVMTGGTDISTGQPFEGTMTAPSGSTVVNPLTTLVNIISQSGNTSVEQATSNVLTALGLDSGVDLLNFDPIAEAIQSSALITDTSIAIAVQAAAVQVNTLMSQTAALLDGAGISTDEDAGIGAAYAALAQTIASASGSVDLSSSATIEQVIGSAATEAGADTEQLTTVETLSGDAAQTMANLNQAIDDAVSNNNNISEVLSAMAAVQIVAETIENEMETGAESGDVSGTTEDTTGSALDNAVEDASDDVGDVDGDGDNDDGDPIPPTGGGGGGGSAPTFTVSLDNDVVTFSGTATGDITLSWSGGPTSFASFSRGGLTATTIIDYDPSPKPTIILAAGQTLSSTAADLEYIPISGDGNLTLTGTSTIVELNTFNHSGVNGTKSYSISDTVVNLLANGAAEPITSATAVTVTGDAAGTMSVAKHTSLTALTTGASWSYILEDSVSTLGDTNSSVLNGASNITASSSGTIAQVSVIHHATNSGTTTFSSNYPIRDIAANYAAIDGTLVAGVESLLSGINIDPDITDAATIAQLAAIDVTNNTQGISFNKITDTLENLTTAANANSIYLTNFSTTVTFDGVASVLEFINVKDKSNVANTWNYSLEDSATNLLNNGAAEPISSAATVAVTGNAAGTLTVANYTLLQTLTSDDSWTYSLSDTFDAITTPDGNNAVSSATAITATGDTDLTDAQHDALIAKTTATGTNTLTLNDAATINTIASVENYILANFNNNITLSDSGHTITGGSKKDTITAGSGADTITGGDGADTIYLVSFDNLANQNDDVVDTIIFTETTDGSITGGFHGHKVIYHLDLNGNNSTDDRIAIGGALKTLLDDDSDNTFQTTTTDGSEGGNQVLNIGTSGTGTDEITVLSNDEVDIGVSYLVDDWIGLITELDDEINFSAFSDGDTHLFLINTNADAAGLLLYTDDGSDDTIVAADLQLLGIFTQHNDGIGMVASDIVML
ncbi:MAG: DUF4214 domain-containing protein [gamma proteobacterium symbiont of Taylorina sp.]|nr:DUF4214 domain-containing protein [gamma proteobacterium symbiont of Taylorina sp.]